MVLIIFGASVLLKIGDNITSEMNYTSTNSNVFLQMETYKGYIFR